MLYFPLHWHRTEHLTEEEVQKSEEMKEKLEKGMFSHNDLEDEVL